MILDEAPCVQGAKEVGVWTVFGRVVSPATERTMTLEDGLEGDW